MEAKLPMTQPAHSIQPVPAQIARHPRSLESIKSTETASPWMLPLLAPDEFITPELDRILTSAARAAHAGDNAARDALYQAFAPKLDRATRRYRRGRWGKIAGRAWEQADIDQEAYLVFVNLIATWSGYDSFPRYLFGHFTWRLASAIRRLHGDGPAALVRLDRCWTLRDESAGAAEALALLETLAADLPPIDRALLLGHIRDGESFGALAHRLQINRRTVRRRWLRLLGQLRASLEVSR
jgi:DNA-directed RNA polymerase specialized sigma24 family protein